MAKGITRTNQSMKNATLSIISQGIQQLLRIAVRIVFIRAIGQELLGVNSLFTEILTALQLVELGVGPAMAFSLYKPLAENDEEKVKSLMALFKKAYRIIGAIVLILGVGFTPFYTFFINGAPDISNLNLIYLIFVFDTGISYFFSYYRTLLISDQKKYVDLSVQMIVTILVSVFQMILITITHSYMIYLILQVIGTISTNFIASKIAIKEYPYLKDKNVKKLDNATTGEIKKNIFAMIFHKIGTIVRDATDNLFISKYISLAISGVYSNYSMITKALATLIGQIFNAVLSSVGNLHITADSKAQKEVFYNINYINFWIATFCACCFGVLAKPFILVIANETYLLGSFVVVLLTLRFYLDIMRKTTWMFCEAAGVYWKGKSKPIWEAVVNLVVSWILVKTIGISGIFIGTIITILVVDLPIEPYLAFKYVLNGGLAKYYLRYFIYLVIFGIIAGMTYLACMLVTGTGITALILKAIIAIITSNVMFVLCTFKTKEFKYAKGLIKNYSSKIIKRRIA